MIAHMIIVHLLGLAAPFPESRGLFTGLMKAVPLLTRGRQSA